MHILSSLGLKNLLFKYYLVLIIKALINFEFAFYVIVCILSKHSSIGNCKKYQFTCLNINYNFIFSINNVHLGS